MAEEVCPDGRQMVNGFGHGGKWGQAVRAVLDGHRDALEEDKALARRIIQQFVAKIVIKEKTGTLYYTFPFPDDLGMPSAYVSFPRRGVLYTLFVCAGTASVNLASSDHHK
jgi:hypothetical protein